MLVGSFLVKIKPLVCFYQPNKMRMLNSKITDFVEFPFEEEELCVLLLGQRRDTFSCKIDWLWFKQFKCISVNGMNKNMLVVYFEWANGWRMKYSTFVRNEDLASALRFHKNKIASKWKKCGKMKWYLRKCHIPLWGSFANCLGQFISKHYHIQLIHRLFYLLRMIWGMTATIFFIDFILTILIPRNLISLSK